MKRALVAIAVATLSASIGCSTSMPQMRVLGAKKEPEGQVQKGPTYLGMHLKTGQLVLTESPDATSFLFPLIPKKFYPFTHVAILAIEDGEPWVYDVTGEVKTFPLKKRLMDNVTGKMYRRKLYDYVAPNLYAEIYDPPEGADGEKIAAYARARYKDGVEFDAFFDYHDHTKMFCSELVSLAIASAGGPTYAPEESNPNPSIVQGMQWLGVPPGEALPAGKFADPKRYVGALGQFSTRASAWAYFEAKHELHRRFTMDQRLGYMLTIDGKGRIDVRPEISGFAMRAAQLFDREDKMEPDDPRIALAVRKLADETFGSFSASGGLPAPPTPPAGAPLRSAPDASSRASSASGGLPAPPTPPAGAPLRSAPDVSSRAPSSPSPSGVPGGSSGSSPLPASSSSPLPASPSPETRSAP